MCWTARVITAVGAPWGCRGLEYQRTVATGLEGTPETGAWEFLSQLLLCPLAGRLQRTPSLGREYNHLVWAVFSQDALAAGQAALVLVRCSPPITPSSVTDHIRDKLKKTTFGQKLAGSESAK